MIFSPLPGNPLINQGFGQNPQVYAQFGMAGHNGIDFDAPIGTLVFAPHDGVATVKNEGNQGYGLSITIDDAKRKSVLAHLSETFVQTGQPIYQGDPIGKTGQSGFVTGPHLHWTFKIIKNGVVQNKANGFEGAMDVTEFTRLWLDQDLHHDGRYADAAIPYLSMEFSEDVYLKNSARNG